MVPKYKFYIQIDNLAKREVTPNYKSDLALEWGVETNQQFYRKRLSGKIVFINKDYELIMNASFNATYYFHIEVSRDWGKTYTLWYSSKFMRTDCTINVEDRKITVQPDVYDEYNNVLAGMEKEFNLIELAPEIQPIIARKRPLIQIYTPGDSVVSCFLGGTYWEQDATAESNATTLINKYYFAETAAMQSIDVTASGFPLGASGQYVGTVNKLENGNLDGTLYHPSRNYNLKYTRQRILSQYIHLYRLYNVEGVLLWQNNVGDTAEYMGSMILNPVSGSGAQGTAALSIYTTRFFVRYLLDVDTIRGIATYQIPSDDIVANNRNYRRVIGLLGNNVFSYTELSNTPTEWGRASNGKYFVYPYSMFGDKFYPVARSRWGNISYWFRYDFFNQITEKDGWKDFTIRDNYPISSVISVFLTKIAPGITHEPTPEYSQFLYSDRNPISSLFFRLFVTPKSNILVGEYQQPAQKALSTLAQFMDMLAKCFKCYWYIEDGKFKIEHIEFFRNGMSYSYMPNIGVDLTEMKAINNGKEWAFATSEYSFDKTDMAQRFQYQWMDEVTTPFQGLPIEVLSNYVTEGKIEEINVSTFTSDIDLMLLNPSAMSQDGFALLAAVVANGLREDSIGVTLSGTNGILGGEWWYREPQTESSVRITGSMTISNVTHPSGKAEVWVFLEGPETWKGDIFMGNYANGSFPIDFRFTNFVDVWRISFRIAGGTMSATLNNAYLDGQFELPIVTRRVDGTDYYLQNGYLAFVNLQPGYLLYDMPALDLEVNENNVNAYSIERKKKQTLSFPANNDINPMKLVKTHLGNGQIDKLSLNLSSLMTKTTLKYDTE